MQLWSVQEAWEISIQENRSFSRVPICLIFLLGSTTCDWNTASAPQSCKSKFRDIIGALYSQHTQNFSLIPLAITIIDPGNKAAMRPQKPVELMLR